MARTTPRGVNAMTVWMIVFVALWLVSTVLCVILYTGREELVNQNNQLRKANAELISPAERASIELAKTAAAANQTVAGALETARAETAALATGERGDDVPRMRTKRDELLRAIRGDSLVAAPEEFTEISLLAALTKLYDDYKNESTLRRKLEDRAADLDAKLNEQIRLTAAQRAEFDKRVQEEADRTRRAETDRETYRKDRDQEVARLESEFKARREQTDAELTRVRQEHARADRQLSEMRKKIALRAEEGDEAVAPELLAKARKPDGEILKAVPGDDVVYINRGRNDRLVLGLRFTVYPKEGDGTADNRPKARIEVVSIDNNSSECKILNTWGSDLILEGDWIANPVYDPDRPLSFLVAGEFDLNRDGAPDPDGRQAVETLVVSWGGRVTDQLDALTDFLVLGRAPKLPPPSKESRLEPSASDAALQRQWDDYMEIVTTARNLAVPVLTQDVFLNFLGYSQRFVRK